MPGKYLGEFELYLMLAVAALGDEATGARIRSEVEARTGRRIAIGAMYTTLSRLGDKGLLEFGIARDSESGRSLKFYHMTDPGREATRHSAAMLRRMMDCPGLAMPRDSQ